MLELDPEASTGRDAAGALFDAADKAGKGRLSHGELRAYLAEAPGTLAHVGAAELQWEEPRPTRCGVRDRCSRRVSQPRGMGGDVEDV